MKHILKLISFSRKEGGAALATVMLLVAVISIAAVSSFDALGFAVKRTTNNRLYQQARFYALGGEHIARRAAEQIAKTDQALLAAIGFNGENEIRFPIDGGVILGHLDDTSNCFNINSLVQSSDVGALVENPEMGLRFTNLLLNIGISENEAELLVASATDWLDSDTRPLPRGAEDYQYAIAETPYRAANTLMADVSELSMVNGFTPSLLAAISPLMCVLPHSNPAMLNVNSLTVSEAPLLAGLVSGQVDLPTLQGMIASRPAAGYDTVGEFWQQSVFEGKSISQAVRSAVDVRPEQFTAAIQVRYFDANVRMTSRIFVGNDGKSEVLSRQFGVLP